jgi:alkyl sulfatase BDS1-like metallo-beta-lactamase superfamily hydrolase
MLLKLDENDAQARTVRADASRAMWQRTSSANARGFYITEALAMERDLKLGDQPVDLDTVRTMLETPDIEKLITSNIDDSFQYLRYLVDPRKVEDSRLEFTVAIDGEPRLWQIELRNSVVVISDADRKSANHAEVSRQEWSEFVVGQRSIAGGNEAVALFESVLDRGAAADAQ